MRRNSCLMLTVLLCFFFSGCVYLTGEKTYWVKEYDDVSFGGPGKQDAQEQIFKDVKYNENDGRCLAIGVFPGYAQIFRESHGREVSEMTALYAFCVPFANILLGAPTISSLFVAPFDGCGGDMSMITCFSILGVHKWTEPSRAKNKLDARHIERVIVKRGSFDPEEPVPSWISDSDTKVYFDYPGFSTVASDLERFGKVDVVHEDGISVRRFEKAKKAFGKITYSDYAVSASPRLMKRIEFREECQKVILAASEISEGASSERERRSAAAIKAEIRSRLTSMSPGTDLFNGQDAQWLDRVRQRLMDVERFSHDSSRDEQPNSGSSNEDSTEFDL